MDLETTIFILSNHTMCFIIQLILPLKKGEVLHLNELEFRMPKDALCHIDSIVLEDI